jgi:hypothetical protein
MKAAGANFRSRRWGAKEGKAANRPIVSINSCVLATVSFWNVILKFKPVGNALCGVPEAIRFTGTPQRAFPTGNNALGIPGHPH